MYSRLMCVLALCLVTSSAGFAGEQSGVLRRISCPVVRYYVAQYSASAAEQWARSKGASDADIEAARRCLKPETTRTAKAPPKRPLALGTYGW
ncbi:hypothetical protein [Bradyrhizobium valentinum]|jgi:hypothetical protein|uniref:Uncharacterized protein n=1 Tax=Bradyrhizobium valentinum TaxID=1518501 RepID=A0A0R3L565_9BRAD|nr:hypothetical protein [Bradyrhizobium valentinum]KRR03041.1 hypothetical protein CQ10_18700 [Bradyrhizobium valentinum]KRR07805.1 hypothetical protein CP49_07220 [Bradyrhizobium valentinum]